MTTLRAWIEPLDTASGPAHVQPYAAIPTNASYRTSNTYYDWLDGPWRIFLVPAQQLSLPIS